MLTGTQFNAAQMCDIDDESGETALFELIRNKNYHGLNLVVSICNTESNEFINHVNKIGETALFVAASSGQFNVVKWLLRHGSTCLLNRKLASAEYQIFEKIIMCHPKHAKVSELQATCRVQFPAREKLRRLMFEFANKD